jgi:hypothetical protein
VAPIQIDRWRMRSASVPCAIGFDLGEASLDIDETAVRAVAPEIQALAELVAVALKLARFRTAASALVP